MKNRSVRVVLLCAMFCVLPSVDHVGSAADIDTCLAGILKQAVNHQQIDAPRGPFIIGNFNGNAQQDLAAGSGLRKRIADQLKIMEVQIVRRGRYPVLSGEYSCPSASLPSLEFTLRVSNDEGREVASFPETIAFRDDAETIIDVTAPTLSIPPGMSGLKQGELIQQAIVQPQIQVNGKQATAVNGQCGVQLVVGDRPCQLEDDGGVAFAPIPRGSRYELLLTNRMPHAAVASVSIDGLDVFAFADLPAKPPGFIIEAGQTFRLKGWFITSQRADTFVVGDFADSAAAKELGTGADAGVIVVKFRAGWPQGETPPPGERPQHRSRSSTGTLRGEPVQQRLQSVPFEIGSLREVISIRYGS